MILAVGKMDGAMTFGSIFVLQESIDILQCPMYNSKKLCRNEITKELKQSSDKKQIVCELRVAVFSKYAFIIFHFHEKNQSNHKFGKEDRKVRPLTYIFKEGYPKLLYFTWC